MSLPFLTAARRMQTRDPTVKVLFALWSLAMVVTVIATAAAAAHELRNKITAPRRYTVTWTPWKTILIASVPVMVGLNFSCVGNGPPGQET